MTENTIWTQQDQSLFKLLDACADIRDGEVKLSGRGRVLLIGGTQCGKTTLLRYWAEKLHGLKTCIAFCGTESAEDLAGWPVRDTTTDTARLAFTNPSVIPHEFLRPEMDGKWVLIIDEVDKTPQDVLSVLLSVYAENRLRSTIIKPAAIVSAANPFTRKPHASLLARLIGVPYPPSDYDFWGRTDLRYIRGFCEGIQPDMDAALWEHRLSPPGSFHRLAKWARTKIFWEDMQVQDWILEGSFSEQHAASIRSRLRDIPTDPPRTWAESATPPEVAAGLLWNIVAQTAETAKAVYTILHKRAADDATGEMARVLDAFYGQRKVQAALEPHQGETDVQERARRKVGQDLLYKKYTKESA